MAMLRNPVTSRRMPKWEMSSQWLESEADLHALYLCVAIQSLFMHACMHATPNEQNTGNSGQFPRRLSTRQAYYSPSLSEPF